MPDIAPDANTDQKPPLFVIACVLAAGFWVIESYMDTLILENTSFTARLLPSDLNELWMRGLVCVLLIAFGLYAQKTNARILDAKIMKLDAARLLKAALSRTIMGNYPICDSCKSIRIHENIWIPPERFIAVQSEAEFTSSRCGHCQSAGSANHASVGSEI